jgi:glycosyltransferase involved in cell wall biosynthesis
MVLTLHSDYQAAGFEPALGTVFRSLLDQADRLTVVAGMIVGRLGAVLPKIAEGARVVHNGVEPIPIRARRTVREAFELLVLGRLIPAKGIDLAVEAFRRLYQDHPQARLTILGSGPLRSSLERQVRNAGLVEQVRFLAEVPHQQVEEALDSASMLVLPSRVEGLPMTLLEAASRGCPVVACDVGGVSELIEHGVTGLLCPPDDLDGLEASLRAALQDPEGVRERAAAARQRVESLFGIERTLEGYQSIYEELMP